MNKYSDYNQNLIMQDVYVEIVEYIQSKIYANGKWLNEDIHDIVSLNEIVKIYGGIGCTDNEIAFLYTVATEHLRECRELNNRKQK